MVFASKIFFAGLAAALVEVASGVSSHELSLCQQRMTILLRTGFCVLLHQWRFRRTVPSEPTHRLRRMS